MLLRARNLKAVKYRRKISLRHFERHAHQGKIAAAYKPNEVEKDGFEHDLSPSQSVKLKKCSMILPPPNVTGHLHLGHALMCTIQDVICRHRRTNGFDVTWVPGTDHAGIATQVVVEKKLFKEQGLSRHDLGREDFLKEIWKWKNEKGDSIVKDLKKLGATLSWDREYFTMDPIHTNAVNEAFISLFNDGLITREKALVNWSCSLESTISDIEVENMEIDGPQAVVVPNYEKPIKFGQIFYVCYKVMDHEDEVIVATTRPETILGDVAVAVNPTDEKYTKFQGKDVKLWHPFRKEPIPLIFDEAVDKEFGTGAVKITPAHDKFDFELAQKHKLAAVDVINEKGRITLSIDEFQDLPRFVAREKMLHALADLDLLRGIRPHSMQLPICSRSKDIIEYMLRPQWFLNCNEMAQAAMDAVKTGRIKIIPSNYETEWFRWLSDCKKWCISRQLWWGHRIPAYLCTSNGQSKWIAAKTRDEAVQKAEKEYKMEQVTAEQDVDVLDTWFSSSLLPFSAFGWPKDDFCKFKFYPLDLMETGHDILFFWVARMAMMGLKLTEEVPFKEILLHGIVCDSRGRKMSKSLGNIILPDQVIKGSSYEKLQAEIQKSYATGAIGDDELRKSIEGLKQNFPNGIPECGTDALRFTLCSHNITSRFINFDVTECNTNKLFFNKIWQATRFTLGAYEKLGICQDQKSSIISHSKLSLMDHWILSKLANMKATCEESMNNYDFHLATKSIKSFFYTNFCDVYLETTKRQISKSSEAGKVHCAVLAACLKLGLQIMAAFTPCLSRTLLQHFINVDNMDATAFFNENLEKEVDVILEICANIRQVKSQNKISRKHEPKIHIFPLNKEALEVLQKYEDIIEDLTLSNKISFEKESGKRVSFMSTASHLCSFGITTNVDLEGKGDSMSLNSKKLQKLEEDLRKLTNMISKEGYKRGASDETQKKHQEKVKQLQIEIETIRTMAT